MTSTRRVLARASASPWSRWHIDAGRAITLWIVDPASQGSGGPSGGPAAQVNGCRKSVCRYPAIKSRATKRSYLEDVAQTIERRHDLRTIANLRILMREVLLPHAGKIGLHSTRLLGQSDVGLRKRGRRACTLEQGPRTCLCRPNHPSTSERSQPMDWPRKRSFLGKCPTSESAASIQRCRRVSRATSCDVRISFHDGNRSLTQGERGTSSALIAKCAFVRSPEWSMLMTGAAHDLWFRLLKDELSLKREYEFSAQARNAGNHRIFGASRAVQSGLLLACSPKAPGRSISQRFVEVRRPNQVAGMKERPNGYE